MVIDKVLEISPEIIDAFNRLLPQLSSTNSVINKQQLTEVITSPTCYLYVARDSNYNGTIIGSLTLVVFRIPTGIRAWIDDVVVDLEARNKGVGTLLIKFAISQASELGAKTVDLTSRPSREAANRLYQRLGFIKRTTNVYRYNLVT